MSVVKILIRLPTAGVAPCGTGGSATLSRCIHLGRNVDVHHLAGFVLRDGTDDEHQLRSDPSDRPDEIVVVRFVDVWWVDATECHGKSRSTVRRSGELAPG